MEVMMLNVESASKDNMREGIKIQLKVEENIFIASYNNIFVNSYAHIMYISFRWENYFQDFPLCTRTLYFYKAIYKSYKFTKKVLHLRFLHTF